MVDEKIKSMLDTLIDPSAVARVYYEGEAETYLTFQLVVGARTIFYDDECAGREYVYRVDVYSKVNHLALVKQLETALDEMDCYEITIDPESYENATGYYHVPVSFKIMEVTE